MNTHEVKAPDPKYKVMAYQFHGPKAYVWYREQGEDLRSVISADAFHRYLCERGIGAARVSLLEYLSRAPSWQYVAADIARYMEWVELAAELARRQADEFAAAPYAEVVTDSQILYLRNYA